MKRPRQAVPPAAPSTETWKPSEWILKTLEKSGGMHLLNESRPTPEPNNSSARSSTEAPPAEESENTNSGQRQKRTGSDTLSLTQAVEAYCDSTLDSDEEQSDAADEATPLSHDTYEPPAELLFSSLYQGHVTMGKNGLYFGIG